VIGWPNSVLVGCWTKAAAAGGPGSTSKEPLVADWLPDVIVSCALGVACVAVTLAVATPFTNVKAPP